MPTARRTSRRRPPTPSDEEEEEGEVEDGNKEAREKQMCVCLRRALQGLQT